MLLDRRGPGASRLCGRRKAMLEDIGILTGGKAVMEETGIKLEGVRQGNL
jgi:chaperonin GroEL (HSP60 family)